MENEKRLVNAEAISRKLKNAHCAECNVVRKIQCSACWVEDVLELLEGEAVDAVEVMRCKDCKHWTMGYCNHFAYYSYEPITSEDDFCSYGERNGDGNG